MYTYSCHKDLADWFSGEWCLYVYKAGGIQTIFICRVFLYKACTLLLVQVASIIMWTIYNLHYPQLWIIYLLVPVSYWQRQFVHPTKDSKWLVDRRHIAYRKSDGTTRTASRNDVDWNVKKFSQLDFALLAYWYTLVRWPSCLKSVCAIMPHWRHS